MSTPDEDAALDRSLFRDVIGRFASGVTVITTTVDGTDYGTTASAVSSLSMEPPMLLICLNKTSETRQAVTRSDRFAVNILSEGQAEIASAFARKSPDKFAQAKVDRGPNGMPLIPGSLAQLECVVTETAVGGTHTVFMGEVLHAEGTDDPPLTYYRGRFGRFQDLVDEGARTQPPDVAGAHEAIDARWAIEIAVVDRVSGHLSADDARRLDASVQAARRAAAQAPLDIAGLLAGEREFHTQFVGLLGNDAVAAFFADLELDEDWLTATGAATGVGVGVGPTSADYLGELLDACTDGDADRARRILGERAETGKRDAQEAIRRAGGSG